MNTSAKGRRSEHRARKLLEAEGYVVCRSAASKGASDLVAWNAATIRFISVKSGQARPSRAERAALVAMVRPANSSVETWTFPDREDVVIDVLSGPNSSDHLSRWAHDAKDSGEKVSICNFDLTSRCCNRHSGPRRRQRP